MEHSAISQTGNRELMDSQVAFQTFRVRRSGVARTRIETRADQFSRYEMTTISIAYTQKVAEADAA